MRPQLLSSISENKIESNTVEANIDVDSNTTIKPATSNNSPNKVQTILTNKKRIIHRYFDELSQTYLQSHNRDFKDFSLRGKLNEFDINI